MTAPFTPVTVTGTWTNPDATAASGKVYATLSEALTNDGTTTAALAVCGVLDETGALMDRDGGPFELNATDDPGTTPEDAFYTFSVRIDGQDLLEFNAALPHASSPVALLTLQEDAV